MIQRYFCWQCDKEKQFHEGKISMSKLVFTCYTCLKNWELTQSRNWKIQNQQEESYKRRIPLGQMSLFDAVDTLNSVF